MVDIIDANGLTVKTLTEVITDLTNGEKQIYGNDINVEQNSPDGQLINIYGQGATDLRELLVGINASFDPDQAQGRILDQRVVINNIERKGGTYTIQPVSLTINGTVTLSGLDSAFNNPDGTGYTVQDNAGNKFILIDSVTLTTGTYEKDFRAAQIGEVLTTVNTITTPVTVVLGVTSINNPNSAISIGSNEESDAALRVRRQQSVSLGSVGYLNGLLGAILEIDGVSNAAVFENYTASVDANGIPAHGIWAIVSGGANTDIANVIYNKKSYGANMKGSVTVNITTPSNQIFTAMFDRPSAESLYIRFDIQPTTGSVFNQALIKSSMVANLEYKIGDFAETSTITAVALNAINTNGGGGVPVNVEISKNGSTWFDYLTPTTLDKEFVVDTTRITITVL